MKDTKQCVRCGEVKAADESEFYRRYSPKRGLKSWCRACDRDYLNARRKVRLEKAAGRPAPNACEICGEASSIMLAFDHDHATGEFRGWLCSRCNTILGQVNDDPELLDKMIVYLSRARRPRLVVA